MAAAGTGNTSMTTTTLYLIRHGETEGAETKRYKGSIDVPLSINGGAQMLQAAAFVRHHAEGVPDQTRKSYLRDVHGTPPLEEAAGSTEHARLSAVYASDLQRASRSAEIFASEFELRPIIVPGLRERHFGVWEGMTFEEIRTRYPREFTAWARDPLAHAPVGGEETASALRRVMPEIEAIIERHCGEQVAVISHGGVIRLILCHYLGAPLSNIFRIEQDYAAINIIEFWKSYPLVKLINCCMNRDMAK